MALLALAGAACGGSDADATADGPDTSQDDGGDSGAQTSADTGASDGNCGMHVLESLDDDCEGIGSAQQVIDVATVEQMSELQWSDYASEDVTHTPAAGTTALTVSLRYDGGEARCFHYCDPCPGQPCGAAGQPARIEVDAFAELSTVDGALAEDWPVIASTITDATQSSFTGIVPVASIAGTLSIELLDPMFDELEVSISGILAAGSTSGALSIQARVSEPTGPAITAPLATWPAP